MTRDDLVAYLSDEVGEYLRAAGRLATDAPGKTLRPIIDNAIRAAGYVDADLAAIVVPSDEEAGLRAQALYRALLQLTRDLGATMVNTSLSGDSYSLRSIYDAAKDALAEAKELVLARFGTLDIVYASGAVGYIDLNFLEPIDGDS